MGRSSRALSFDEQIKDETGEMRVTPIKLARHEEDRRASPRGCNFAAERRSASRYTRDPVEAGISGGYARFEAIMPFYCAIAAWISYERAPRCYECTNIAAFLFFLRGIAGPSYLLTRFVYSFARVRILDTIRGIIERSGRRKGCAIVV